MDGCSRKCKSVRSHTGSSSTEETENPGYIVESLSPCISPKKHVHKEAMDKEEKRNNLSHSQRDRSNMKYQSFKNHDRKRIQTSINVNEGKFKCSERDLETEKFCPFQKQSRLFMKDDVQYSATPERSRPSENKLYDTYQAVPKRSNFRGGRISGTVALHDKYKGSQHPSFDRNDLASRERKLTDTSVIYGSASLRLERLKKQLSGASRNKYQLPSSGNSSFTESAVNSVKSNCTSAIQRKLIERASIEDIPPNYSSDKSFGGNSSFTESAVNSWRSTRANQRKLIERASIEDIPPNYSSYNYSSDKSFGGNSSVMESAVNSLRNSCTSAIHRKLIERGSIADIRRNYSSDKSFGGNSSVMESAVNSLRNSCTSAIQRKLIERPDIEDIPPNYSSLNAKEVKTYFNRREVNNTKADQSSQKLVRDYNHKRVADSAENNSKIMHDEGKMYELYKQTEVKRNEVPLKNKFDVGSSVEKNTFSSLFGSSKYEHEISQTRESRFNQDEECRSVIAQRKNMKYRATEKQFENSYVKPYPKKTECTVRTETNFVKAHSNSAEEGETKQISHQFSPNVSKQKARFSKGGITKIDRKVQKQLRTAAPRSLHLTAACVQQKRFTSQTQNTLNQTNKTSCTLKDDEEEEMDWEPIEPEKVVLHVEELRKEGVLQNDINPELMSLCRKDIEITSQWFVVLDTNVLLSHLDLLCALRDMEDKEIGMPTLFIPWVVLQELDGLKSSKKKVPLQYYARKAVNFLFENLLVGHSRVRGQPKSEADKHKHFEADDSILQCSLNLQKESKKVLLLSNDRNLFNKATVSGVECCSACKLAQELESRRSSKSLSPLSDVADKSDLHIPSIVETLKQSLGHVLEEVLRTEMVLVYDRNWSIIVARKPPWTLSDILFCLLKHWIAVFHLVLPAAARELIEKIKIFVNCEVHDISLENLENIIKTCMSLMHLVSSLAYKEYVDNALSTMKMLLQKLEEHKKLNVINSLSTSDTSVCVDERCEPSTNFSNCRKSLHSDFANENGEHTKLPGSIIGSKGCVGSTSGSGSKVEADEDCLSILASTFSDETSVSKRTDTNVIEKRAELVHKYLNTIFEKVVVYCGMLCDVMGIDPCIQYQRPDPFPSVEILNQNILSYIKCVSSLLRCFQGILAKQPSEFQENSPVLLNFFTTLKDSIPANNEFEESLLPQHVFAYSLQTDTRHQLEVGKKQFEQLQAVLNQALNFFMVNNKSSTPLPLF